jgi:SpoVK/Ycf46/Vps4 family AAA+-type ATPase
MGEYFRVIEPERQLLCIIEDIDGLCDDNYYETELLNILDGIGQMENTIYLATTNYPEKLKERILNRPSRFDRRYKIEKPDSNIRKFYFEKKLRDEDLKNINLDE